LILVLGDLMRSARLSRLQALSTIAAIWVLLVGGALFVAWPRIPSSTTAWAVFVLVAPPVTLALEWLGQRFLPSSRDTWPSGRSHSSVARVSILVVRLLLLVAVVVAIGAVVGAVLNS
jgi:hypothetical protein